MKAPVRGWSMAPLIKEGSQLVVNFAKGQAYYLGDVVLFLKEGKLAAHRIVKTHGFNLTLKGDNNSSEDGSFKPEQLVGKVEKILYPEYSIDLTNPKNQLLKHLFVFYSLLNQKLPLLTNIRKLYKIPLFKASYHFLVKS